MATLCRLCQNAMSDQRGICAACRLRVLKAPAVPRLELGIWKIAIVAACVVVLASWAMAATVLIEHGVPAFTSFFDL